MSSRIALASLVMVFALSVRFSGAARADIVFYDPALGTLPQAQGFTLFAGGNPSPSPVVSSGLLNQGPTVSNSLQYWGRTDETFDFMGQFSMWLDIRIISSGYATNLDRTGNQRSGYYMAAQDSKERYLGVGISSGGIYAANNTNDPDNGGTGFIPFNTTDGFHTYLLTSVSGVVKLYADGQLLGTTTILPPVVRGVPNEVDFGDMTSYLGSQSQLRYFGYSTNSVIPEPSSFALCWAGAAGLAGMAWQTRRPGRQPLRHG